MKTTAFLIACLLCIGCNEPQQKPQTVSDLQLNMQIDQVQAISEKNLVQVSAKKRGDCEVVQYRGWFYDGSEGRSIWGTIPLSQKPKPYILTFNMQPDSQEGHLVDSLVQIQLDEGALMREAMDRKTKPIKQNRRSASGSSQAAQGAWLSSDNADVLQPDGYGLGVHRNRYSQPVALEPDFGGVYGEHLDIKTDAYGMGVHADQYGRPVREKQWGR